jgi:nicotinamide mononucleotide (NMN) deamidase PncC
MSIKFPPEPLDILASEVAALLRERGETLSVVETAAGGLISSAILSTPGASKIYKGSYYRSTSLIADWMLTGMFER